MTSGRMPHRMLTPQGALRPTANNLWDEEPLWILRSKKEKSKVLRYKPNYFANDPASLQCTADVHSFMVGTGASIFEQLQPLIESAQKELVIVTCFWASSDSLKTLVQSLRNLSKKAQESGNTKIKVFIGFSSLSWKQKILQTGSLTGRLYPPKEWPITLGLPSQHELPGLDMTIKSIFVRPFSVMHPKFVIIDRKIAWLPSCNVSWEAWFEGAVVVSGPVLQHFVKFWQDFWLRGQETWPEFDNTALSPMVPRPAVTKSTLTLDNQLSECRSVETIFLPSPHHAYALCLPFIPSTSAKLPPPTPLTTYLRTQIQLAQKSIFIQTPNITAYVVLHELLSALQNGIHVSITTSPKLMILEQLVTAGTTTSRCVSWLIKQHKKLLQPEDPEADIQIGRLQIWYFKPRKDIMPEDSVQSHLKLTVLDDEIVVLGSQNMDRASWFTSQELGVAFKSKRFADGVKATLAKGMQQRRTCIYDSGNQS